MAIKSKVIVRGMRLWINTKKPTSVWLEMGKKRTEQYLALDAVGLVALSMLPAPYNVFAVVVARNNRSKVKAKRGPNGVFVKISQVVPFYGGARKRTRTNMKKRPRPW